MYEVFLQAAGSISKQLFDKFDSDRLLACFTGAHFDSLDGQEWGNRFRRVCYGIFAPFTKGSSMH